MSASALAERIDVGPAAPKPVSNGGPESMAFQERINVGPASAVNERINVGPASALDERINVGPVSAVNERIDVGPVSALDERINVGPAGPALSSRDAQLGTNGPATPGPGGGWAAARPRSVGTSGVTIGAGIRAAAGGRAATTGPVGATTGPGAGPGPGPGPGSGRRTAPGRPVALLPVPGRPSAATPEVSAAAKIRVMFRDYRALKDPAQKQVLRTTMLGLCEMALPKAGDPLRGAYVDADTALIEDINAVLYRDQGQAKAQARYVTDAQDGATSNVPASALSPTKLTTWKQQDVGAVLNGAAALHSGVSVSQLGPKDLKVIEKYGLTHAEIIAIRAYTAANYEFINPATENNRRGGGHDRAPGEDEKSVAWMKAQNKKMDANGLVTELDPAELEAHFAEGSLHAGVLMMALNKLKDKKGTLYRGERLTPQEFQENYISKAEYKISTFKSNSRKLEAAAVFARGTPTTGAAKTISVMCVLEVLYAKDIKDLSLYTKEAEWLLMPGASFAVGEPTRERLDKYGATPPGVHPATECYTVHLTQKVPEKVDPKRADPKRK